MFRPLVLVCTFLLSLLIGYIYSLERCKPTTVNLNTETGKSGGPNAEDGSVDAIASAPAQPPGSAGAAPQDNASGAGTPALPTSDNTSSPDIPGTITVILTQYKRPTLRSAIANIRKQSVPISEIIVYQNKNYQNNSDVLSHSNYSDIRYIHNSNYNTGFFGRFSIPLILNTEYVAIFDDDTIPAKDWLKNCIRIINTFNAICGANGRIVIPPKRQMLSVKLPHPNDVEVDFVGHCWVFKRKWVYHMWRTSPSTLATAEDIHFSASAWVYGGVKTYVPKMPKGPLGRKMWPTRGREVEPDLDGDEHASWRYYEQFLRGRRGKVIKYWQRQGWKMVYVRSKGHVTKYLQTGGDLNMHQYHAGY